MEGSNHEGQSPLAGLASSFVKFHDRYSRFFVTKTRSVVTQSLHYLSGLFQTNRKNMERMLRLSPIVSGNSCSIFFHILPGSTALYRTRSPRIVTAEGLAFMQGQRYFVERAFQGAKSNVGLDHYQVRGWQAWHHHYLVTKAAKHFIAIPSREVEGMRKQCDKISERFVLTNSGISVLRSSLRVEAKERRDLIIPLIAALTGIIGKLTIHYRILTVMILSFLFSASTSSAVTNDEAVSAVIACYRVTKPGFLSGFDEIGSILRPRREGLRANRPSNAFKPNVVNKNRFVTPGGGNLPLGGVHDGALKASERLHLYGVRTGKDFVQLELYTVATYVVPGSGTRGPTPLQASIRFQFDAGLSGVTTQQLDWKG